MSKDYDKIQKKILANDILIGGIFFVLGVIIIIVIISGFFTGELYCWEESILYFIIGIIPLIIGIFYLLNGNKKN